MFRMLSYLF